LPANPSSLTNLNGKLFFVANDGSHGAELWKSDGTQNGTTLVKDILPGATSSAVDSLLNVNGVLFFSANDGSDTGLWKSDGSASGTVPIRVFADKPHSLTNANGKLFFVANDGVQGSQLWVSDGTVNGTHVVKQFQSLTDAGGPAELTNLSGMLVFSANDGTSGYELWKTDGTESGTTLIRDINPGAAGSSLASLSNVNGTLFLQANDGESGRELWKSDGTFAGTVLVRDLAPGNANSNPRGFTALGNDIVFAAQGNTAATALWKTDGTTDGTVLVKDVRIGLTSPFATPFSAANGSIYFNANDGARGYELWKSDGTQAGTAIVRPMTRGSSPYGMEAFDGYLYYSANDGIHGDELWRTDGTQAGTSLFADLGLGIPHTLIPVGDRMYFKPENSPQLWVTDGTLQGTMYVRDSATGKGLVVRNDYSPSFNARFFTGLAANVNGTLFFAANDGQNGYELWKTDGTASGAVLVKDIPDGGASLYGGSFPTNLVNVNGTLFFKASDNPHYYELWKSDGTEAGTVLVKDIFPDGETSHIYAPTNFNGRLIFWANDGVHGPELWVSDGTEGGTQLLKDIEPGAVGSGPSRLTVSGNALYFMAYDDVNGYALWKTDATSGGTNMVYAFGSRFFDDVTDANGKLYFTQYDPTAGRELWVSDGTLDGTHVVRDIWPGTLSSYPSSLSNVNGTLYFRANDGTHGTEVWCTDGTSAGTQRLTDIAPGVLSSGSQPLVEVLGRPVFLANDGIHGGELWTVSDVNGAPTGTSETIYVRSSIPYTFFIADFGFIDPTDAPRNHFNAVKIVKLPPTAAGTLQLGGAPVLAGQFVSAADLTAGQLCFVPAADATISTLGTISFRVQDDGGTSGGGIDLALFNNVITIRVNHAPLARDDVYYVPTNGANNPDGLQPWGVISNDVDFDGLPDDDNMKAILLQPPLHGQLAWNLDGIFTYTPDPDFAGTDSFTYQDDDGHSDNHLSNVATVTLNVAPVDSVPVDEIVVNDESYTTKLNMPLVVSYPGMLANDYSTHGNTIWSLHGQAADFATAFAVQSEVDGSFTYIPPTGFIGQTYFTYDVYDGEGVAERMGTVTLRVTAEGDHPPTLSDSDADLPLLEEQTLGIQKADLLATAVDPDDDTIQVKIIDQPSHGALSLLPNGDFGYIPSTDYSGPDFFTYVANDGQLDSSIRTATLQVAPVNDPPRFTPISDLSVTDESGPQSISWAHDISPGAPDESWQHVNVVVVSNSNPDLFSVQPEFGPMGGLTFTPAPNVSGSADISLYLQDDGGTDNGGVDISPITIVAINVEKLHPWHNAAMSADVNDDGNVVAEDVIDVINFINAHKSGPVVKDGQPAAKFYDVTGDDYVAADDAVTIINYINAHPNAQQEAGGQETADLVVTDEDLLALLAADAAAHSKRRRA
jgi:ELWxxDGT repeat protein